MPYELENRLSEKLARLRRTDATNRRLAIFVHGFMGNYLTTWGKLPELLQANAPTDSTFGSWDYAFVGYATGHVVTYLDIARRLSAVCRDAFTGAWGGEKIDRVSLIGHSLGTLAIRQLLCAWHVQPPDFLRRVHSVTLFGPPLAGSALAHLGALVFEVGSVLKPGNPQIRMLHGWAECAHGERPWPASRVVLGEGDMVVGSTDADLIQWPGDEARPIVTTLDHGALVKPESWQSVVVDTLRGSLQ